MATSTQINRDVIPGTVHLVDVEGNLQTQHSSGQRDVILVPQPSNNPEDPLNWSPRRKALATFCTFTYVLTCGISTASIYSVLEPISKETGLTLGTLNAGTGYMFLLLGWGCLFWQPVALVYGKRPVYLLSLLANTAIMIWAPCTKTKGQWLANKIIQGFFEAPIESLCEISIADIYFTHERGTYMGAYALMLFGSNFIAPIIAGFINDSQGWEWVLYWSAIISGVGFIILFFFMEETNFYGRGSVQSGPGQAEKTDHMQSRTESDGATTPSDSDVGKEKQADIGMDVEAVQTGAMASFSGKTWWQKLKLIDNQPGRPTNLFTMMYRPILLLRFPVIAFSGFQYGLTLVMFNIMNATASMILGNSPYSFRASMVGLSYFAPLIGASTGALYSGWFGDKLGLKLARRNGGIQEPEHKLWLFTLSLLLVPGALILWGVGAYHQVHWFGLLFGMGVLGVTNAISATTAINYTVDSYKDLSGEAVITIILVRNTMSFAIGYGITPWIENTGLQNTFLAAAFIGMGCTAIFLPMIKWGKDFRVRSKESYWKYVETSVLSAH